MQKTINITTSAIKHTPPPKRNIGTCKLMDRLMGIEGVKGLSYESIEQIKRIICGTHNGVCSERYSGIKDK